MAGWASCSNDHALKPTRCSMPPACASTSRNRSTGCGSATRDRSACWTVLARWLNRSWPFQPTPSWTAASISNTGASPRCWVGDPSTPSPARSLHRMRYSRSPRLTTSSTWQPQGSSRSAVSASRWTALVCVTSPGEPGTGRRSPGTAGCPWSSTRTSPWSSPSSAVTALPPGRGAWCCTATCTTR